MIPTFVIFLREGVEASMIVAILLAYLDRSGQRRHFRDVFIGVGVAGILMVGGGFAAYRLVEQYDGSRAQTIFETCTYLLAAVVLTYMTFWMQSHSRTLSSELQRRSEDALSGRARFGLGALAFQAVGREGVETVVFTLAIVFASKTQRPTAATGANVLLGGALGLAVAMAIAVAIYRFGRKLNVAVFFRVVGVLLMVFAAGLLADAVENLQQLGWLTIGGHVLWNSSAIVNEGTTNGDVLHTLLGYADHPTVLQLTIWAAYLVGSIGAFVGLSRRGKRALPAGEPVADPAPAVPVAESSVHPRVAEQPTH